MSKQSAKQRYVQLKEWLETYSKSSNYKKKPVNKSRLDYYNEKGAK